MRTELVTTLKRRATEIIAALSEEKEPILITQHGMPAAYLMDVESYEATQYRLQILEGIARGEQAIAEGRVLTHAQTKQKLKRWLS